MPSELGPIQSSENVRADKDIGAFLHGLVLNARATFTTSPRTVYSRRATVPTCPQPSAPCVIPPQIKPVGNLPISIEICESRPHIERGVHRRFHVFLETEYRRKNCHHGVAI